MDKTIFMEKAKETLENHGYMVETKTVVKAGEIYSGFVCCKDSGNDGEKISISFNMDIIYAEAVEHDPNTAIENMISSLKYAEAEKSHIDTSIITDYAKTKKNLFMTVLSRSRNPEFLEGTVHYPVYDTDLVLVPRILIPMEENNGFSPILRPMLDMWRINPDTLYQDAMQSTVTCMPPVVMPLIDKIRELTAELPIPPITDVSDLDSSLYLISNQDNHYGASVVFYSGMLEKLGSIIGGNFYILPSSIHECLIMPAMEVENQASDMISMVREINEAEVRPEERLSDNIFFYDIKTRSLTELS